MAFLLALFLYLSLYTWNLRTGSLDRLAGHTGLEFVGIVLKPGTWVASRVADFWGHYIYLVGVRQENDVLKRDKERLLLEAAKYKEEAAEAARLRRLLDFSPPRPWTMEGARVIAHRLGPNAALNTVLTDKGTMAGFSVNAPVITPEGVAGRVLRAGLYSSTILLVTDPNSRIPVRGQIHRTSGILTGQGPGNLLQVGYVPLNAPLDQGETLLTSGLAGIFPKGLPVARVTKIERSEISLFQTVWAEPVVNLRDLEEVLLLRKDENPAVEDKEPAE